LDAMESAAAVTNSLPKRLAAHLVPASQLADDSLALATIHFAADEPSAVLEARQSLGAAVPASAPLQALFLSL
jgi:hypothetical protein